jgi:general secretion pathway protein G
MLQHIQLKRSHSQGFSLIEIMVVVVIIGILAALIVPRIMTRPEQARVVKAKSDIAAIQSALELYKLDSGFFPSTDQGLEALVKRPSSSPAPQAWKTGGYLKRLPLDPWGRPYHYLNPGVHNPNDVDIFSYGPTGQPGGSGDNASIGNWDEPSQS